VLGAVFCGRLQSPILVPFLFSIFINVFDKVILDVGATDQPEQEEITPDECCFSDKLNRRKGISAFQNKTETQAYNYTCSYTHTHKHTYTDCIPNLVIQGYKVIIKMSFPL